MARAIHILKSLSATRTNVGIYHYYMYALIFWSPQTIHTRVHCLDQVNMAESDMEDCDGNKKEAFFS